MYTRWLMLFVVTVIGLGSAASWGDARAATVTASIAPGTCEEGDLTSPARYKICLPAAGTGDLVIWAHGYKVPADPLSFQDAPPENVADLPALITGLGFSYATTTYRSNGLVVLDAKQDIIELLAKVYERNPELAARRVYLIGASMGGLIATQLAESNPNGAFDGALALCGLVGNFPRQINHWGNFNVLFRTFFQGVVAGWPSQPSSATNSVVWDSTYKPAITAAVMANTAAAQQLLATSKAAVDTSVPATALKTIEDLAYFSFLSVDDSAVRLGGNPFENRAYWYWGSASDWMLNRYAPRYGASATALAAMQGYETTGQPVIPMVMVHTTLDPIVPVDQSLLYFQKVAATGNLNVTPLLVSRYGHCNFTSDELLQSFGLLVSKVTGAAPAGELTSFMSQPELLIKAQEFLAAEQAEAAIQAQHVSTRFFLPVAVR